MVQFVIAFPSSSSSSYISPSLLLLLFLLYYLIVSSSIIANTKIKTFMASWVKKELAKLKIYTKSNNRFLLPPLNNTSPKISMVQEVVLAADLRCSTCRRRVDDAISRIDDMDSMVVHLLEKKVTITRKSVAKGSSAMPQKPQGLLLY